VLTLRPFEERDLPLILDAVRTEDETVLWCGRALEWPHTISSLRRYRDRPHRGGGDATLHTAVAGDDHAVGHAKLVILHGVAHLGHILVAPPLRGRGLGGRLVDALVGLAASRGCDHVVLNVFDVNRPAIRVYERAGFVEASRTPRAHRAADGRWWANIRMERFGRSGPAARTKR